MFDPRRANVMIDANAFDRHGDPIADARVDRVEALIEADDVTFIVPDSVRAEVGHPNTPPAVQRLVQTRLFSLNVPLTSPERKRLADIEAVLQGNATPGKHAADARHVYEAVKYGAAWFITEDDGILRKRGELQKVVGAIPKIVTLEEFLEAYDRFVADDPRAGVP